tara:strand:- start:38 stop:928 length:891 start_codon:yes stop_codon:yes gene_type:complete
MKPVAFLDLFCGMGGFTVGAVNAGATCIMSVDNWNEACAVHRTNHPEIPVTQMELGHPDHWRFFKRMVDDYRSRGYHIHIHGSPPCQALSNASTRSAEEGMPLVLWYLDLVKKCEPDSWSMENVVPVRKKLPEGTPSVVLNSADFGVPQTRRRCYAGEGWAACPSHTKEEWVSVIEALPHLEGDLMDSGRASAKTTGVNPATGKKEGGSGPLFRELSDPSYTVMSNPRDVMMETAEKPVKIRSLTLPETLVLQGFNPDYDLSAARTMKSRWTMVGNAVPPPVAEAVIRGIANAEAN